MPLLEKTLNVSHFNLHVNQKNSMKDTTDLPDTASAALDVKSANFETRKAQRVNDDTVRIKPSTTSLAFSLVFIVLGLILVGLYLLSTFTAFDGPGSLPLVLLGLLFLATGLGSYYDGNEQLVINRENGVAFMQSWHPSASVETTSLKKHVQPQDIIAIQTISRLVKSRTNRSRRLASYTEYQVNLCTSDSERHNVFVTRKLKKAEDVSNVLTQIFDVPLRSLQS